MVANNNLFCLEDSTKPDREAQRLKAFLEWDLLAAETVPIFEAATQTAADFLEAPICILGFVDDHHHWFKSAVGLSRLGLMNQLAITRSLPRTDSLCTHVVENHQVLAINDTKNDSTFAHKILVQHYGIRAYLGAPLMDNVGNCLGAIAVMDLQPRTFSLRDIKFLELMARWSMSEFQRNKLLQAQQLSTTFHSLPTKNSQNSADDLRTLDGKRQNSKKATDNINTNSPDKLDTLSATKVKLELIAQLTQELRTPLTSVLGMASVISHEVYGPLTSKQKEYLEIIQNSGKHLLSLVNEITELGALDNTEAHGNANFELLNLTSVDIEMLCQQVINNLEEVAKRKEQQIQLLLEPGRSRLWVLDKDKIKQLLYHLVSSVIQSATNGSFIRIHISQKDKKRSLNVSVSHPWLGEGISAIDPYFKRLPTLYESNYLEDELAAALEPKLSSVVTYSVNPTEAQTWNCSKESLRLLLSYYLAELHGGQISMQGTPDSGYRYLISLPELVLPTESA